MLFFFKKKNFVSLIIYFFFLYIVRAVVGSRLTRIIKLGFNKCLYQEWRISFWEVQTHAAAKLSTLSFAYNHNLY